MWKLKKAYAMAKPSPVIGKVDSSVDLDVDGEVRRVPQVGTIDLTSDEAASQLPSMQEMSIENLSAAGVDIKQVDTTIKGMDSVKAYVYGDNLAEKVLKENDNLTD